MKFELLLKTSFELETNDDQTYEDIQVQAKFKADRISRELGNNIQVFGISQGDAGITIMNYLKDTHE